MEPRIGLSSVTSAENIFVKRELISEAQARTPTLQCDPMPFAPINGIDLYYEIHGAGPAVLFAHGQGGNHLSWWQQIPFFYCATPTTRC